MTGPLPELSLVLPVHNEADNLRWLLPHLATVLPTLAVRHEVVIVDDGSSDGSAELATATAAELGLCLRIVHHDHKSGYGATVGDGLRASTLSHVAFTDADGQFEVADFALLIALLDGADLVGGWREVRQDAAMRSVVSWVFNTLVLLLYRLPYRDIDCAMKVMRREVLDSIELRARSALINTELYFKARHAGWRIVQCPVRHHPRRAGRRSGARPRAIVRAIKELIVFRWTMRRTLPAADAAVTARLDAGRAPAPTDGERG
jgi:glycosyltransferase involved in cell wall biosynthesis